MLRLLEHNRASVQAEIQVRVLPVKHTRLPTIGKIAFCVRSQKSSDLPHSRHTLQALPFVLETPSQIQRKDALHRRIAEIEDALSLFSRPQVLIKIDEAA